MTNNEVKKIAKKSSHCLVLTHPLVGHINPMLQFSKRLEQKGLRVTLVVTKLVHKTMNISLHGSVAVETISDGYDDGGRKVGEGVELYLERFRRVGSETLVGLVERLAGSGQPVRCIVYDAFLPWVLDVAKRFGLVGAAFFTQSCAVDAVYYHANKCLLKAPAASGEEISMPGLPRLGRSDLPTFVSEQGSHPAMTKMVVDQFSNVERADWVLCNTYHELEEEVLL